MTQEERIEFAEDLNKLRQTLSRMNRLVDVLVPCYHLSFSVQDAYYGKPYVKLLAVAFDPSNAIDPILATTVKYENLSSCDLENNLHLALISFHDMITGANIPEINKIRKLEKEVIEACGK
jgi:hypothetical protein